VRREAGVGVGLFEVLADGVAVGDGEAVLLAQHRHGAGGVHLQEFLPPFPDAFQPQLERYPLLGHGEADLAGIGRKGEVVEDAHGPGLMPLAGEEIAARG
jgi:hypothetical protein